MNIIHDYIPFGRLNRPGRLNPCEFITIHETGNTSKGAGAKNHASYIKKKDTQVSWHYTVDDKEIYQHLPDNEDAFHASDGAGNGNRKSIGIEICVNSDGDFGQACENAAELVRELMKKYGIPLHKVVQHNYWSGKNCPKTLRAGGWADFLEMCKGKEKTITLDELKTELISRGINAISL